MKHLQALAAGALLLGSMLCAAQQTPGVTPEMIAAALPEEGAPKAIQGSYAVTSESAFGRADLKVFRPADLGHFPQRDILPVVVWGNGGCLLDGPGYAGFLQSIASHGFLVVTTAGAPGERGTATNLEAGIDWAEKENQRVGSPLAGRIDMKEVAAMGHSCSGRLSIELGADPRVRTIGAFNIGLQPSQLGMLALLHGSVLLVNGHERDFAFAPSRATFDAIDKLPAFYGARHGGGHRATFYHPGGGEYANVASSWLRWQLKGDMKAGEMFRGSNCGLCDNANWDVQSKMLDR